MFWIRDCQRLRTLRCRPQRLLLFWPSILRISHFTLFPFCRLFIAFTAMLVPSKIRNLNSYHILPLLPVAASTRRQRRKHHGGLFGYVRQLDQPGRLRLNPSNGSSYVHSHDGGIIRLMVDTACATGREGVTVSSQQRPAIQKRRKSPRLGSARRASQTRRPTAGRRGPAHISPGRRTKSVLSRRTNARCRGIPSSPISKAWVIYPLGERNRERGYDARAIMSHSFNHTVAYSMIRSLLIVGLGNIQMTLAAAMICFTYDRQSPLHPGSTSRRRYRCGKPLAPSTHLPAALLIAATRVHAFLKATLVGEVTQFAQGDRIQRDGLLR